MDSRRRALLINIVLIIVIFGMFALLAFGYLSRYDRVTRDTVHEFISSFGAWAPVAFGVMYIVSSPVPFLAPVLSTVSGLLFGALWGTLLTLLVATLSAFVPFYLARRLGQDWVESKLKGRKLDDIYQQSEGNKGFLFILLMRLIPVLPWEVQNYVGGLTKVSPLIFASGTILGIIPGSFSLNFLGAAATRPGSWEFALAIALKLATGLIPGAVALISRKAKKNREIKSTEAESSQ